jgi:hypothetical protein
MTMNGKTPARAARHANGFGVTAVGQGLAVLLWHDPIVAVVAEMKNGDRRLDTDHFAQIARALVSGLGRTAPTWPVVH